MQNTQKSTFNSAIDLLSKIFVVEGLFCKADVFASVHLSKDQRANGAKFHSPLPFVRRRAQSSRPTDPIKMHTSLIRRMSWWCVQIAPKRT